MAWEQLLFWKIYLMHLIFKGSLLIWPLLLQPYISWSICFCRSNGTIFVLTGQLAVIYCLSISFSSRYYDHFLEYSQPSILLTLLCIFLMLKVAAIKFSQRTFLQRILEHQSPWNKLIIEVDIFPEQYQL